jgi:3D (Asp-Asp-Asp) domain-containing protein
MSKGQKTINVDTNNPKILTYKTKPKAITVKNYKEVNIVATFYGDDAYQNGGYKGLTASGKRLSRGMVATPTDIPMGTKIEIEGMGDFVVEDRGSSKYIHWINEYTVRIDIFVPRNKDESDYMYKKRLLDIGVLKTTGKIFN